MNERLLTMEQVCEKLGGVKAWTVRGWVSQRRIPYTKVGRLTRFPEGLIDEWIRANTVRPGALGKKALDNMVSYDTIRESPR